MNNSRDDKNNQDEVTLRVRMGDVINAVARSGGRPMISEATLHDAEGEDIRKAWFRHVLSSVEKLNDLIETVRSIDITNLKADLKDEIRKVEARLDRLEQQVRDNRQELLAKVEKLDTELSTKIDRSHNELLRKIEDVNKDLQAYKVAVDSKFNEAQKEFQAYKKEVVDPLKVQILTISVKIGVWATLAGVVGSGLFAFGFYLVRLFIFKTP